MRRLLPLLPVAAALAILAAFGVRALRAGRADVLLVGVPLLLLAGAYVVAGRRTRGEPAAS